MLNWASIKYSWYPELGFAEHVYVDVILICTWLVFTAGNSAEYTIESTALGGPVMEAAAIGTKLLLTLDQARRLTSLGRYEQPGNHIRHWMMAKIWLKLMVIDCGSGVFSGPLKSKLRTFVPPLAEVPSTAY